MKKKSFKKTPKSPQKNFTQRTDTLSVYHHSLKFEEEAHCMAFRAPLYNLKQQQQ